MSTWGSADGRFVWRPEHEELDLQVRAYMGVRDEGEDAAPREPLDLVDEALLHRILEGAAGFLHEGHPLQLDHRLLDVGIDAAHDDGEQVVLEQLGLRADRDPVVVALVQGDHRRGHGGQQLLAVQRWGRGRHMGLPFRPLAEGAREAEGGRTQRAVIQRSARVYHGDIANPERDPIQSAATIEARRHHGEELTAISDGLVALLKEFYGRGPTQAKSYYQDDLVVCILRGGYTQVEQTLRQGGRGSAVIEQRMQFQELMRQRFEAVVEKATGRKVIGFMSGNQQDPDLMCEVFVLDPSDLV
jgi:uncharacterized protein YbcI